MTPVAFIDANVPIYAAGRDHPNKAPCTRVLALVVERPSLFVTDAEVIQELLHRYRAIGRWTLGREVVQTFSDIMRHQIEPVYAEDVLLASRLADEHAHVSARDLVHVAVMRRLGISNIVSADTDLDPLPGIVRLDPAGVSEWAESVLDPGTE